MVLITVFPLILVIPSRKQKKSPSPQRNCGVVSKPRSSSANKQKKAPKNENQFSPHTITTAKDGGTKLVRILPFPSIQELSVNLICAPSPSFPFPRKTPHCNQENESGQSRFLGREKRVSRDESREGEGNKGFQIEASQGRRDRDRLGIRVSFSRKKQKAAGILGNLILRRKRRGKPTRTKDIAYLNDFS